LNIDSTLIHTQIYTQTYTTSNYRTLLVGFVSRIPNA